MKTKLCLLTIGLAATLCACTTLDDPAQRALALADARDVGQIGTTLALSEKPEYRKQLVQTRDALKLVEALPQDKATLDDLVKALAPIQQLQSPKVQLYIAAGKPILRRILAGTGQSQEVDVSKLNAIPQFAKALREGMDVALGP